MNEKLEPAFTPEQKTKISKMLKKKLSPDYISYRVGQNRSLVPYIEGWTAISLANQIFGFDGWSSQITRIERDYIDQSGDRFSVGYTCMVRVTLKDGTYREDVGFGSAENQKNKSLAIGKARKEACTDALKRALRQFGNALGNCCYDKEFINKVKGIKKSVKGNVKPTDLYNEDEQHSVSFECENVEFSYNPDV